MDALSSPDKASHYKAKSNATSNALAPQLKQVSDESIEDAERKRQKEEDKKRIRTCNQIKTEMIDTINEKKEKRAAENQDLPERLFKHVMILVSIIVFYFIFTSTSKKSRDLFQYNALMMDTNGTLLVDNTQSIMQLLYSDLQANNYNIMTSQMRTSFADFVNMNIQIDTSNPNTFASQGISQDEYYDIIAKYSVVDDNVSLTLSTVNNTEEIYHLLIAAIEAYEKCNSVASSEMTRVPFPILEISVYFVVLAVVLAVLFVILRKFEPFRNMSDQSDNFATLSLYRKTFFIAEKDTPIKKKLTDEEIEEEAKMATILKYAAIVTVIAFGILFSVMLMKDSDRYRDSLYSGDAFIRNQCA